MDKKKKTIVRFINEIEYTERGISITFGKDQVFNLDAKLANEFIEAGICHKTSKSALKHFRNRSKKIASSSKYLMRNNITPDQFGTKKVGIFKAFLINTGIIKPEKNVNLVKDKASEKAYFLDKGGSFRKVYEKNK